MENPFVYGQSVLGDAFTDRRREIDYLFHELQSSARIFLISPRRYGKSSLLQVVKQKLVQDGLLVAYVDLYKIASMNQFADAYASAILNAADTKIERAIKAVLEMLVRLRPKIAIESTGVASVTLDYSFQSKETWQELEEVYQLPERIARKKGTRFVVMLDEFQEASIIGGDVLEKQLRAVVQTHTEVSYVFAGSKRHLLYEMVHDEKRPFYRMGEIFNLGKIPESEMADFVLDRFSRTGYKVELLTVEQIINKMRNIPYNVQLLCHRLWAQTRDRKVITDEDVALAIRSLVYTYEAIFGELWDNLTVYQKRLLRAIALSKGRNLFSSEVIVRYGLETSSSVSKGLSLLQKKNLIERHDDHYEFNDIFFERWILERG